MKVDIWSDIRCPFCYIGKRKFESALEQFENKSNVTVEWHSFELDPHLVTQKDKSVYDYLAERKGGTKEWAVKMHERVTETAAEVGLEYNFDKAVVANSFDAHRLIQLAKTKGLGDLAEELIFYAYFTNGKDISDNKTLYDLGTQIGLEHDSLELLLSSDAFTDEVHKDEMEARNIGVNGVPFFVFNNKYAVSGAQSPGIFLQALKQTWEEFKKETVENPV